LSRGLFLKPPPPPPPLGEPEGGGGGGECLEERDLETEFLNHVVKTRLTSFSGTGRTRARIFVRLGEVDVFGKSLKRLVFFNFIFAFIVSTEHIVFTFIPLD